MKEYLQMLIWTMFFIVIVEMTFPVSDIKKYLKFVLGFVVLYVIVSPVVDFVIGTKYLPGESLESYIQYYQGYVGDEIKYSELEEEKEKQQEGLLEIYLAQMEKQAQSMLEAQLGEVIVEDISVEGQLENIGFSIDTIELEVSVKESDTIGVGIGEKDESTVLSEVQLKKQIESCLNDFYNLDNTNIYITVQMN